MVKKAPAASAAQAAWLSLAQLDLDHLGNPQEALRSCVAYLRRNKNGVLVREARLCRIEALGRLGRSNREIRAIEDFLQRYPQAIERNQLRLRLESLTKSSKP